MGDGYFLSNIEVLVRIGYIIFIYMGKKKYDVFISYSRKDTKVADKICYAFDEAGITYFIDTHEISGGMEFPDVLATAIDESKVFLFLASENSYASIYTKNELTYVVKTNSKNIIPYFIDDSTLPRGINILICSFNWRNIEDHPINTVLVDDVLHKLGRERKRNEDVGIQKEALKSTETEDNICPKCGIVIPANFKFCPNCGFSVSNFTKGRDMERMKQMAIEESRMFNQCLTQSDYMNYLAKYPKGAYAAKARSIIEDLSRREIEESRIFNQCSLKNDYLEYLRKYPNGKYVKKTQKKIKALEHEKTRKTKEESFWKRCNPNDKHSLQEYIKKYPDGKYAIQAKLKIADLERIEQMAIEESRMFNQCLTQSDYMNYLAKYPKGAYAAKARSIIEDLSRREIEESRIFNQCSLKNDYLEYLKKYPNGKYVKEAQEKIKALEHEKTQKTKEESFWKRCNPNDKHSLQEYIKKYPNGMYAIQARLKIADLERIEQMAIEESRKGNNKKKPSMKAILGFLISAIVLCSVAFFIRDEYKNFGPFLYLVSNFFYMFFAFEVVSNKKLGMAICITGWFIMSLFWTETQSILTALEILGLCSFAAVAAYFIMYRE